MFKVCLYEYGLDEPLKVIETYDALSALKTDIFINKGIDHERYYTNIEEYND